jgi:hypothetical protein
MTKEEVLSQCIVEGNVVKLPQQQLERSLYLEVAKSLQLIGGKWKGGKVFGFVFQSDPTELLEQISNGDKRNLKKEFQFFGTPSNLANRLVELAEIENGMSILEPSAGQGAIIKAINRKLPNKIVDCYELMSINKTFLNKIKTVNFIGDDFLVECNAKYDRIIANPPFSKNQDIEHIYKMYDCLNDSGIIVSVASKHWQFSSNKKESDFKNWLGSSEIIDIEAGEFKESGTMISACIIKIRK